LKKFPVVDVLLSFGGATQPDAATTRITEIQHIILANFSFIFQ
jgi:hypothetical protein